MNIIAWIIWRIKLYYPIHAGDVETASSYICAEKDTRLSIDEFEEGVGALLLLLFALINRCEYQKRRSQEAQ
jgi:hypothetical protein